jgi:hypothetical protein
VGTPPRPPDPLQPVLQDVEGELRRRLHEACEAEDRGVSTESAAEIRRLEDSLLAAAVAAEQTLTLRRHMRQREDEERGRVAGEARTGGSEASASEATASEASASEAVGASGADASEGEPGGTSASSVREFRDSGGRPWRAWPVTPGLARPGRSTERLLGQLHQGWICFEALDSPARRRLPCTRARWVEVKDEELEGLLEQAITAPERRSGRHGAGADEPEGERPAPPG